MVSLALLLRPSTTPLENCILARNYRCIRNLHHLGATLRRLCTRVTAHDVATPSGKPRDEGIGWFINTPERDFSRLYLGISKSGLSQKVELLRLEAKVPTAAVHARTDRIGG